MSALTLDNISVPFGGIQALAMLISSVEVGEKRAIIGPNGAGKTTLFNVISGMVKPTSGRVLLFDQEITDYPVHLRAALRTIPDLPNYQLIYQSLRPGKYYYLASRPDSDKICILPSNRFVQGIDR